MNLRKDHQIQSKRSLLQSGGNTGSLADRQSPKIVNSTKKTHQVLAQKTDANN